MANGLGFVSLRDDRAGPVPLHIVAPRNGLRFRSGHFLLGEHHDIARRRTVGAVGLRVYVAIAVAWNED